MKFDVWIDTQAAELEAEPRSPLLDAKVMMVDDEPLMTALIETHLEEAGYTNFVSTNDPRQALAMVRRERPGVVLLDLMMPQMSGFEVLEAIRADRELRYTPVIVLTAASGADARLRALRLGATDFLAKPVDESELALRVRNTLAFQQYADRALNFDAVTDLPNERLFASGLGVMLERSPLVGGLIALFSIHLPGLRDIRNSAGERVADDVAREIARRLRRLADEASPGQGLVGPSDRAPCVARLGADRFGLQLEGLPDIEAVQALAKRLVAALCHSITLGLHEVAPQAWIGVAVAPTDGRDGEVLRKSADLAAGHAQQHASLHVMFASTELNARSLERLTLGSQLRGAAARGELRLHYQPKIDLASGRIVGAEALVRWQHPQRGLLMPGHFVPLAEETGLIVGIGDWVIARACADAAAWTDAGLGPMKVAVNVAQLQVAAGNLATVLRQALFDSGLTPERLVIELTESMLMQDVEAAIALMNEIKALGATVSIDDFGTGYSSLGYLKQFPLDELKIDRAFVRDLPGGPRDEAIARSVVEIGHSLGMTVIAEGVETATQLECLRRMGCDQFQGFLFGGPVPQDDFVALARRSDPA